MTPIEKLRAEYQKLYPLRDPATMNAPDPLLALLSLFYKELDERSVIKKCPPAFPEGYTPQRNLMRFPLDEFEDD